MFEFIRNHQRLMQILLMLLIVPSFVLVGVSSYQNNGSEAKHRRQRGRAEDYPTGMGRRPSASNWSSTAR